MKAWLKSWTSFCLFGIGVRTVKGYSVKATYEHLDSDPLAFDASLDPVKLYEFMQS